MPSSDPSHRSTAVFTIQAIADPGVLPAALGLFAKHGLIPSRWVGNAHVGDDKLFLQVEFDAMADDEARRLATGLRRLLCVETVVTDAREMAVRRA
jgi:hypothetical protein